MHYIKIEFSEKELNEIMEEIDQAQEKIFESWERLKSMGIAVEKEADCPDEQPTRATKKEMDWKAMSEKEWSIFVIEGLLKGIKRDAIDFSKCLANKVPETKRPYIKSMAETGLKCALKELKS